MSVSSLTLPLLRPARVARLSCMMQKKRAFGPRGSPLSRDAGEGQLSL